MQSIILLVVFFNSMISTFMFKIILNSLPQSSLKYIKHSYSKAHNTFTSWDHHRSILFCLFLWGFWSVLVSLNVKLSICFILRIYIKTLWRNRRLCLILSSCKDLPNVRPRSLTLPSISEDMKQ